MCDCFTLKDALWSKIYPDMKRKEGFKEFETKINETETLHISPALLPGGEARV